MLLTKRAALVSALVQDLAARGKERALRVVEIRPEEVREAVAGNPKATKVDVAEALVARSFSDLRRLVPKRPARAALGLRPRDKYWLHMFDALAVALAAVTCRQNRVSGTSVIPIARVR